MPTFLSRLWLRLRRQRLRVSVCAVLLLLLLVGVLSSNRKVPEVEEPQLPPESVVDFPSVDADQKVADQKIADQKVPDQKVRKAGAKVAPWQVPKLSRVLIPKRLHHFSEDGGVPASLVSEVTSWATLNPDYDVFFWDAPYFEENLLTMPEYRNISAYYWRRSSLGFERNLIARLVILHQYGGVLPELHMRALGSVTDHLTDTACEMAQDRVEKAILMYSFEILPTVSVLACQAKHQFLDFFLQKITNVNLRTGGRVLSVKTPQFITHVFEAAQSAFTDSCSVAFCDLTQRVALAEPEIFMPVIEEGYYDSFVSNCKSLQDAEYQRKEACFNLEANGNRVGESSLAMPIYADPWKPTTRALVAFAVVADAVTPRHRLVGNWKTVFKDTFKDTFNDTFNDTEARNPEVKSNL